MDFRNKVKTANMLKSIPWKVIRFILLLGMCFILLYPLLYMLSMTFRVSEDLYDPSVIWIPKSFTLDNLKLVFEVMEYPTSIKNSLVLDVGSSIIQLLSCAAVGYGFSRFNFRGKGILFGLLVFSIIIPPQILSNPLYLLFNQYKLLDTVFSFYLPAIFASGIRSGLYIFIFRQFFRGMPSELEDSAYVDGCGPYMTFFRIILPNASAALITVFLFSIVWYWNDFFYTNMFFSNTKTLTTALYNIRSELVTSTGVAISDPIAFNAQLQAGCLLVVSPILLVFVFLQKYFTESLERTGIVG
ncbi:MAG: carbohydrate ABC transporter permease [Clostridia bacterium]|nr:carbohydrate ABC transporter permease [Clostridia bacterium]